MRGRRENSTGLRGFDLGFLVRDCRDRLRFGDGGCHHRFWEQLHFVAGLVAVFIFGLLRKDCNGMIAKGLTTSTPQRAFSHRPSDAGDDQIKSCAETQLSSPHLDLTVPADKCDIESPLPPPSASGQIPVRVCHEVTRPNLPSPGFGSDLRRRQGENSAHGHLDRKFNFPQIPCRLGLGISSSP